MRKSNHRTTLKSALDVGIDYDVDKLGLAATQTGPVLSRTETTGCEARDSGNSRCGHEGPWFGTMWTPDEKQALLELSEDPLTVAGSRERHIS
jgi:hypothetical protein